MCDSHCLQYPKTHNVYQTQNQHSRDKVQGHLVGGEGTQDQDPDCQGLWRAPQRLHRLAQESCWLQEGQRDPRLWSQNKRMKKTNFKYVDNTLDAWMYPPPPCSQEKNKQFGWNRHCPCNIECNCKLYDVYKQKWVAFKIVLFGSGVSFSSPFRIFIIKATVYACHGNHISHMSYIIVYISIDN